jgi:hypothetical protein
VPRKELKSYLAKTLDWMTASNNTQPPA